VRPIQIQHKNKGEEKHVRKLNRQFLASTEALEVIKAKEDRKEN
jgi:glucose-6-phosphate isomerase